MIATVRHVTAWAGRTKFQTDGFLFVGVYQKFLMLYKHTAIIFLGGILSQCSLYN